MDPRLEGVHKRFGIAVALTDVDLAIGVDTHLLLVGTNGAGKTTLLRLVTGKLEADRGQRRVKPGTRIVSLEQDPDFAP